MAGARRLVAAGLMLAQAGCARTRSGTADAGAPREGWACREAHKGTSSQRWLNDGGSGTQATQGNAGSAAVAFVAWSLLSGACLASRG